MMNGYNSADLVGRTGKSLSVTVDGQRMTFRGQSATPCVLRLNGQEAAPSALVYAGDCIEFIPAVQGDSAARTVRELLGMDFPGGVLVSIHQNSLPEVRSVHGAQVFYNGAEGSEALALAVQDALNTAINDRPKEIKAAGQSIYLLCHTTKPAVLVECGFLSNQQETELLKSHAYQTRLAITILSAALGQLYENSLVN